ncbi:muramidase family protein [Anaerosalibacter sp. Marseille-P3206]|uniref:muramidase family protein n=1 Tax=Anaerosalibacter sp. Marseille-P3206 TaxID=1871005 RepID=UPI0009850EB9|nr:LysM domain-containing protein [Anaerosalibacter sp. Marseille-P3206]
MKNFKKKTCMLIVASMVGLSSTSVAAPYTVKSGDSFWKISNNFNISLESLMKANNANENTIIYPGQVIEVPNGKKETKVTNTTANRSSIGREMNKSIDLGYGEYLDWFDEVKENVLPIGSVFKVTDFYTGKSFTMKRTIGSFHADCEALTLEDTEIIKEIWGGFNWERRPVIVQAKDRCVAASMTAMPHAGLDSVEGGKYTEGRSGGYGGGTNYDYIKGNGMDGHVDIHFAGSKRHKDGAIDPQHQKCIKIAAGMADK